MNAVNFIILFCLTSVLFFLIDMVWLGLVARKFYNRYLGHLMRERVNWPVALVFYVLYIAGLPFFALVPGLEKASLTYTVVHGSLFGFFTYATYDLTNLATIKKWPVVVTVADISWGTFLSGTVSFFSHLLYAVIQKG